MPVEKKTLLTTTFLSALLFSAVAGTQFVNTGTANPYFDGGIVPPDPSAKPPGILIFDPKNNTVYTTNTITLSIKVTLPESQKASETKIDTIYYEADWLEERVYLFISRGLDDEISSTRPRNLYFQCLEQITDVPNGTHSIMVYAKGKGSYVENWYGYGFYIDASAVISFTVDAVIDDVPPNIVLSVENKTYYTTDIPLGFSVNEPTTQVTYCLDGQDNVTVAGNTTLTNLPYGQHNLTVYATDKVGNAGASETIIFNIAKPPEPFPTTLVAAASGASLAVTGLGLLVYIKKRQKSLGDKT